MEPITNDAVIFGLLMLILGFVFITSNSENAFWKRFYQFVPALLLCYFLPSLLTAFKIVDISNSQLYFVSSRYLLPASLIFFTLSVDIKEIMKLGPKALIIFLTGTMGVIIGGPIAIYIFSIIKPDLIEPDTWKGMTTIAGSWIGGGANQTAMREVFDVGDDLFSKMVVVDIVVGNIWLGILLAGVGYSKRIDKFLKADNTAIEKLKQKMTDYRASIERIPTLKDFMVIIAIGILCTNLAHYLSDLIVPIMELRMDFLRQINLTSLASGFFWLVVIATTLGLILSFTPVKRLEGAGASKFGSVCLYILVATIGMKMDIIAVMKDPWIFGLGFVWILFHALLMFIVAKLIRAPYFFIGVGSTANVGGAASAPIIADQFHSSLAPVGVLLAVLGYVVGTYGAYLCGVLMQWVSG